MVFLLCAVVAICIGLFLYWQDSDIVTTNFTYISKELPPAFDGFKIVQVSDLHNKSFGKDQSYLIKKVKAAAPDMIVVTGDLIDSHRPDTDAAMAFIRQAEGIAPVYFVPGNQEMRSDVYEQLSGQLGQAGVILLNNQRANINRKDGSITVIGLQDIEFLKETRKSKPVQKFQAILADIKKDVPGFTLLLSHRPEYLDMYASQNINLVLSGHAHGGQIRLPFLGGLYAPGQGWLPKYTAGSYTEIVTTMFVSRGLGNSEFPFRVFNRPEIVAVTLKNK